VDPRVKPEDDNNTVPFLGFKAQVEQAYLSGPKLLTCHYWGQAEKA
jgi:hypothetical protein